MNKLSIHDIPIDVFMKYYFQDGNKDIISSNARYQPVYEKSISENIYRITVEEDIDPVNIPKTYRLLLVDFPDISTNTTSDIRKQFNKVIYSDNSLKLKYPKLKENINKDIDYDENNNLRSYISMIHTVHKYDNTPIENIIEDDPINKYIKEEKKQIYYNPLSNQITSLFGHKTFYKYFGYINNTKFLFPLYMDDPEEIGLNHFLLDYNDDQSLNTKVSDLFPNYKIGNIGSSLTKEKTYDANIHIYYYSIINSNLKEVGRIYILPELYTLKKAPLNYKQRGVNISKENTWVLDGKETKIKVNTDKSNKPFINRSYNYWFDSDTWDYILDIDGNRIQAINDYYAFTDTYTQQEVYFEKDKLPLSPTMKYHEYMHNLKDYINIDLSQNSYINKGHIEWITSKSENDTYKKNFSYFGYEHRNIIQEVPIINYNLFLGSATKCKTYKSVIPLYTFNKTNNKQININFLNKTEYMFANIPNDITFNKINFGLSDLIYLSEDDIKQTTISSINPENNNGEVFNPKLINAVLSISIDTTQGNIHFINRENSSIEIQAPINTNIEFTIEPNKNKEIKNVSINNITIQPNSNNVYEFTIVKNSHLSIEFCERPLQNNENIIITTNTSENGQILLYNRNSTDNKYAINDTVYISVIPNKNYILDSLTYNYNGKQINITNTKWFTLLDQSIKNYSINATFKEKITQTQQEILYFIQNIWSKKSINFYSTKNINNIYSTNAELYNILNNIWENMKKDHNANKSENNYFYYCNNTEKQILQKAISKWKPMFQFLFDPEKSDTSEVQNYKYYCIRFINKDNSSKSNSLFAIRVWHSNNNQELYYIELIPILIYFQQIIKYLLNMYTIIDTVPEKLNPNTISLKEMLETSITKDKTNLFIWQYNMKSELQNLYNLINKKVLLMYNNWDDKLNYFNDTDLEFFFNNYQKNLTLHNNYEKATNIISKYNSNLFQMSKDLLTNTPDHYYSSHSIDNLRILLYSQSLKKNLICLLQKDQKIRNSGGMCYNKVTKQSYHGFIQYSNIDNSYIDYIYSNNDIDNQIQNNTQIANVILPQNIITSVYENIRNKNPIEKILNYKNFMTDNEEIRYNIQLEKIKLHDILINNSVLINNNSLTQKNKQSLIYQYKYIKYDDIRNKINLLYNEYLYADKSIKSTVGVSNYNFYINSIPDYQNTVKYIYNNNLNVKENNINIMTKIKYEFKNNDSDKNTFIESFKTKFSL